MGCRHFITTAEVWLIHTGIGVGALYNTTNSQYNTCIGYHSGYNANLGYNNTFVGVNTDGGLDVYNAIAIGQGAVVNTNQVVVGNFLDNQYFAYANWTNISDGRYKRNIKENVPGLAFINKLRPITYTLDATGLDNFLHKDHPGETQMGGKAQEMKNQALREKEQIVYTGFVAQEVDKAAKDLGFDFSGVDVPKIQTMFTDCGMQNLLCH